MLVAILDFEHFGCKRLENGHHKIAQGEVVFFCSEVISRIKLLAYKPTGSICKDTRHKMESNRK